MKKCNDVNLLKNTRTYKIGSRKQKPSISTLNLSGEWLYKAGFKPNDEAWITIYPKTIIIRPMENETE
jgi:hypothetical protein